MVDVSETIQNFGLASGIIATAIALTSTVAQETIIRSKKF